MRVISVALPLPDAVVAVDDRQAVVERLEDVLAELAHPLELVRLDGGEERIVGASRVELGH